ncbi:hypothetical protein [Candidatus Kuenenia sp.]|uniref:hypothetical protein n=1 Tax=Candidatus Kuenenia sp. TaxID=2499824 RepID=UPI00322049B6
MIISSFKRLKCYHFLLSSKNSTIHRPHVPDTPSGTMLAPLSLTVNTRRNDLAATVALSPLTLALWEILSKPYTHNHP